MNAQSTETLLRTLGQGDAPNPACNLHIHSDASDGSDSFKSIISQAVTLGFEHIAFTNHDTTVGLDYVIDLGKSFGVEVIGGVEISAWDFVGKRKVHILGYGLQSDSPEVSRLCKPLLDSRRENTLWQMEQLLVAGYTVDVDYAAHVSRSSTSFYKQHLLAALTDEPFGSEAYVQLSRSLFKGNGICARDITYVDAFDAVRAIVADGGVAVLAHPGQQDNYDLVPELVACGLRGIERFHPDHGKADWQRCAEWEERFGLFHTGGSDYHGSFGTSTLPMTF